MYIVHMLTINTLRLWQSDFLFNFPSQLLKVYASFKVYMVHILGCDFFKGVYASLPLAVLCTKIIS